MSICETKAWNLYSDELLNASIIWETDYALVSVHGYVQMHSRMTLHNRKGTKPKRTFIPSTTIYHL